MAPGLFFCQMIHLRAAEENNRVTVQITNEAKEIPDEKLRNITEAFGLAGQHMDKNSGLGLAIVNACQELMEGSLDIESKDGKFRVTLSFKKGLSFEI